MNAPSEALAWVREFEASGGTVAWSFGMASRHGIPGLWLGVCLDHEGAERARQMQAALADQPDLQEGVRAIAKARVGIRAA